MVGEGYLSLSLSLSLALGKRESACVVEVTTGKEQMAISLIQEATEGNYDGRQRQVGVEIASQRCVVKCQHVVQ